MQITTQLDDDAANKLSYIQQQTGQDAEAILKTAIDDYYQKLKHPPQTPLEALTQSGFIGCGSAEPDLSVNYKMVLQTELQKKYDHC
jgi:hypothetical protein